MRISGLASGMDTESMVKELMTAERLPLDKITKKKQYMEWQRDDYRAVNKSLYDFRNLISDNLLRQSTFIKKKVSTSASDDVSIKNVNSVSDFSGKIRVKQLAETATMQSSDKVINSDADLTKKISEMNISGLTIPTSIKIKAIKEDGTLDGGYEVKINADSTLKSVMEDINKNSGVNVIYDSFTGKLAFTAKHSGDVVGGNEIEFSGDAKITAFLKVDANNVAAAALNRGTEGKNSKFTLNGLETERQKNNFTIGGYEVTLKQANDKDITFGSEPDVDAILESVTKFVDEYNKIIKDLNSRIRETKYRDYQPLTDAEKEGLSEDQIKKWEEKAKSGTLKNDSIISSVLNEMRSALSSPVGGLTGANTLKKIGITTSVNYLDNGKLSIDETKLRAAIAENPNQIYELFAADGVKNSEKGFARRMTSSLEDARKKIIEKAGSDSAVNNTFTLGRLLNNYDNQINRFEDRLKQVENRYWKQFTAMEQAIQKANSQSSYLSNMFSNGA
ncbi:flagellar hook-associated protein 2 [Lysinibacillus sp. BW-2-10]|uniref:flagellar hook-associated protein 2 n=1 Tax=Lysinibacillus sp. BW-2-10 TaxID=2590030 RepID=UPI00117C43E7|nr:flagellar hook-associated protein 2 [Lysinibacillus sp. BW-2-10]TSI04298.1 flagellar hook-associated protein 2 [Lysinibacillus sp. BW-2-10]